MSGAQLKARKARTASPATGRFFGGTRDAGRAPFFPAATAPRVQRRCQSCGAGDRRRIQPKLEVGEPDDRFEREADRVADEVVRRQPVDDAEEGERLEPAAAEPSVQMRPLEPARGQGGDATGDGDADGAAGGEGSAAGPPGIIRRQSLNGEPPLLDLPREAAETRNTVQTQRAGGERESPDLVQAASDGAAPLPLPAARAEEGLQARLDARKGQGRPMTAGLRRYFEPRFAADFGNVRLHTDGAADNLARSLRAKAFTHGRDIYFSSGQFSPGSSTGRHLLAHELTHTLQQSQGARRKPVVRRQEAPGQAAPDNVAHPPEATMNVRLSGLRFGPINGTWSDGDRLPQAVAIALKRFTGPTYRPDLVARFIAWYPTQSAGRLEASGALRERGQEPMAAFRVRGRVPFELMTFVQSIAGSNVSLQLTDSQQRAIGLGMGADDAWRLIQEAEAAGLVPALPAWFGKGLFFEQIGSRVTLLTSFMAAHAVWKRTPSDQTLQRLNDAVAAIVGSLSQETTVIEAIRTDARLINEFGYKLIWPPRAQSQDEDITSRLGRRRTAIAPSDPSAAYLLPRALTYMRTQPGLARRAVGEDADDAHDARRLLLERFVRFVEHTIPGGPGDQALTNAPGRLATHPPHPARLDVYPGLEAPFFDAALRTEHHFTMRLLFPSVFDAFASYSYRFAFFRVPDEKVIGAAESAPAAERRPAGAESPAEVVERTSGATESIEGAPAGAHEVTQETGDVLGARLARDARYLRADVETAIDELATNFGSPGVTIRVTAINGLMRFAGTLLDSFWETLFEPAYTTQFVFPAEGLYLVRATAYPHQSDEAEVTRPPSAAYVPVFARDPEVMAEARVRAQVLRQERTQSRAQEIERLLRDPSLVDPARTALEGELRDIRRATGDVGAQLAAQYWQLDARINALEQEILGDEPRDSTHGQYLLRHDPRAAQYPAMLRQREALRQIYHTRARRGDLSGAERLTATFVSDRGQSINLVLEALDRTQPGQTRQVWYVSDSTTPHSGDRVASGSDKAEAVTNAVRGLLQSGAGYGRGWLSLVIDGVAHPIRIEANSDQLLMEALENVATIASIAAIAAAPFTAGASLYLLIPIGIIGAIPSAYRIAQRVDNETFRWDLQTAMDIVNIAGAVVAGGQVAAGLRVAGAGVRAFRLSGALMITGFGLDGLGVVLLGAGIVQQLEAARELPPGLREARIAEIIGNALLQAGIMIGGALASRQYQGRLQQGLEASEGTFGRWFQGLDESTRARLRGDPELMELYGRMRPDVRALLTKCGSWCIPIDHPPDGNLQMRLQALVDRLDPTPDDRRFMQAYFHDNRPRLDAAIGVLQGHRSLQSMRQFLHSILNVADVVLMAFRSGTIPRAQGSVVKVTRILQSGHVDVATLSRIMDNAHARGLRGRAAVRILEHVEMLVTTRRPGYRDVLADLVRGYNFFTGAEFVLRYLDDNNLWGNVTRFEIASTRGGRRWDAEITGTLIQFKSWSVFLSDSFLRQFAQDYQLTGGSPQRALRWIFDRRLGTQSEIEAMAVDAIRAASERSPPREGYGDPDVVQGMIDAIESGNLILVH